MNREQMIAWLTLEGWELCVDKMSPPLLRSGARRIWITTSGEVRADDADEIGAEYLASERPVDAEDVDIDDVTKLYIRVVREKDHEPGQ